MRYIFLLIVIVFSSVAKATLSFHVETTTHRFFTQTEIVARYEERTIGIIRVVQLPLSVAFMHTFFILPEYRNRGIGTQLLHYACEYSKASGCKTIFIQPEPFDLINNQFYLISDDQERQSKLQKLITLYQRAGFTFTSTYMSYLARLIYAITRISADSTYLMCLARTT